MAFRVAEFAEHSEFVLRNYFCAGNIQGRPKRAACLRPNIRMLRMRILKVRLTKNPEIELRSRAINSKKHIIRRPTQDRETQGLVKVAPVNGEVPSAIPFRRAMARAKYVITVSFGMLGGRTSPLWSGASESPPERVSA